MARYYVRKNTAATKSEPALPVTVPRPPSKEQGA